MDELNIDQEAAEWLVRLEDVERPIDAAEQQAWMAWLRRSPRHVEAYFNVATASQCIDEVPAEGRARVRALLAAHRSQALSPVQQQLLREDRGRRMTGLRWLSAAAAVVACLAGGAVWFASVQPPYQAGVGQQASYRLPDGSSMVLNTRSRAKVAMTEHERIVDLEGEALFTVARDPGRPFKVRTREVVAQAVGTQFNVYEQAGGATKVSVVEGTVRVSALSARALAPVLLSAGQEAEVRRDTISQTRVPRISNAVAWRGKALVFEDASLAEVAREFNRYNAMQFVLAPDVGRERRLSGTFDPLRPDYFQAYLENDETLTVHAENGRVQVRRR